jgi:hypothetical protein
MKRALSTLSKPSITVVLHFIASCTLVPLKSSSISTSQFFPSLICSIVFRNTLHFVEKITFAFNNIIDNVNVADESVKKIQLHAFCGHTHAYMCEIVATADSFYESAFAGHVRAGEK